MQWVRFLLVAGIAGGTWAFFQAMGAWFAGGALFAVILMQCCHRYIHGRWIEF